MEGRRLFDFGKTGDKENKGASGTFANKLREINGKLEKKLEKISQSYQPLN